MREIRQTMLVAAGVAAVLQVVLHFCPVAAADPHPRLAAAPPAAIARR